MTEKAAIKKSIAHWKRMIRWVKKQPLKALVCDWKMEEGINECWGAQFCALCEKFHSREPTPVMVHPCKKCPLFKVHGACGTHSSKNAWTDIVHSVTWGTWLTRAEKMLTQLKSLL